MEKTSRPSIAYQTKSYFLLTKPGIIMGNAITAAGGFALAAKGHIDYGLFLATLTGLSLIIASACTFNNYIDRNADQKMKRTQNRPLATRLIPSRSAILFAIFLGLFGILLLTLSTNLITVGLALIGFTVYVFWYSFLKYRSTHGTLIGSIAGAVPPVVGYCSVSNQFDMGALLLFIMIALWQMPHFFAIAIYRLDEYAAASIPVLPLKKGIHTTKVHMVFYVAAFIISSSMLTIFHYTGLAYAITAAILGFLWLWLSIKGLKSDNHQRWARKMFIFSLVIVTGLCAMIPFSLA
ncbi:MAG: heme o synthase [Anaerolineae bacterium]